MNRRLTNDELLRDGGGSFPLTDPLADEILSLPMYPELERPDIESVAEALLEHASEAPAR